MTIYEANVYQALKAWQRRMARRPSPVDRLTRGWQTGVNKLIPEKMHLMLTTAIRKMVETVLAGTGFITAPPLIAAVTLEERENRVRDKLEFYKKTAAAGGAGTGAGGILLTLADFPLLLSLKISFLFDVAGLYGFDVRDIRERLYILQIFQLAFSSAQRRNEVYEQILHWEEKVHMSSASMEAVDWRIFQQEYRDYIDLAKMLQMLPGIGAVAGAVANYRLMDKLGETAMNCYRLRMPGIGKDC